VFKGEKKSPKPGWNPELLKKGLKVVKKVKKSQGNKFKEKL